MRIPSLLTLLTSGTLIFEEASSRAVLGPVPPSVSSCQDETRSQFLPYGISTRPTLFEARAAQDDWAPYPAIARRIPATADDPLPDSSDTGDNDFYEPELAQPVCKRGGAEACIPQQRPSWVYSTGAQKPYNELTEDEKTGVWNAAGTAGALLKASMDRHVGSRTSGQQGTTQDDNFEEYYRNQGMEPYVESTSIMNIMGDPGTNVMLAQSGISGIDVDQGFTHVEYAPVGGIVPLIDIAASPDALMLLSLWSYAKHDINDPSNKAYSSTLTWNAWVRLAGPDAGKLKYHVRHKVVNAASNSIMSLAHIKYPEQVDHMPVGSKDFTAGHGLWTPDHEAFPYLLTMPNVRTCVNMIIDYNPRMDNPYIVALHTFPAQSKTRAAYIIIVYGPMPVTVSASTQAVDEGTVGVGRRSVE